MPANGDEQLNFLLKCVKYSSNGKVNFDQVATECNIVTKAAAAKRYERLMKANGISPNGGPSSQTDASSSQEASISGATTTKSKPKTPTKSRSTTGTKTPSARKRKTTGKANDTSKKVKVDDPDDSDVKTHVKREDSNDHVFNKKRREKMMKSSNDQLFSEDLGMVEGSLDREDGDVHKEFCPTNVTTKHHGSGGSANNGSDYARGGAEYDINGDEA
ncbi:hypothetical protein ACJ72_01575 [Emergomyces africanus]|uniref:Myb-like DNA-binding domain-containing protein n=1 Tax=Emergomyces africanus TaxID=1955775 RepID=A0A1B7P4V3_9EURO|nr:hypothetical protein ACJ72_01575 [Emergomyces africanus]